MSCFIYVCVILYICNNYVSTILGHRNITTEDYNNLDNMAGKVVSVDTYFEINNNEHIIAKGCTGTMVYGHLNPRRDTPIYAVVTAGQCCNVKAAIHNSGLDLNEYERVMVSKRSRTGALQSFRALKISAHISYGSNFLPLTTAFIIKADFGNQMVTVREGRIVEARCSSRLGNQFQYQSVSDFCVIHVDPRIHRRLFPILTEDNFHHMSIVREEKNPNNCRLIRWNDNEKYRGLEELGVEIVESKKCKVALSTYGVSIAPDMAFRFYCIKTPDSPGITFMKDINDSFVHLNDPKGKDFSDVGTPVICKTKLGQQWNDVEFLLGLATLKAGNYTVIMDGSRIISHLSLQYVFKRVINRSYLDRPLAINTYTHYHDPVTTAAAPTVEKTTENSQQPTSTSETTPDETTDPSGKIPSSEATNDNHS